MGQVIWPRWPQGLAGRVVGGRWQAEAMVPAEKGVGPTSEVAAARADGTGASRGDVVGDVSSTSPPGTGAEARPLSLRPLTPQFDPEQHAIYVEQLLDALGRSDVQRIALAGQYGTGKSSILLGLRSDKRFQDLDLRSVTVSLTTIDAASAEGRPDASAVSVTNLIQKEVVKQLLHAQRPSKAPLSRYRRASRPRLWPLVGQATLAALVAALLTIWFVGLWPSGRQRRADPCRVRPSSRPRPGESLIVHSTGFEWTISHPSP